MGVTTTPSSDKKLLFIAKNPAGKVEINTSQALLDIASKPPRAWGTASPWFNAMVHILSGKGQTVNDLGSEA